MACLEIDVIIDWMKYGISRGYLSLSVIEIRYYGRVWWARAGAPESDFLGVSSSPVQCMTWSPSLILSFPLLSHL